MATWSPRVAAQEVAGTRTENWDLPNSSATVTLEVAFADRYNLCKDLIGNERDYPFNATVPQPLICRECKINYPEVKYSSDSDEQIITSQDLIEVDVTYRPRQQTGLPAITAKDPTTGEEITISERIEPKEEFIRLDPEFFSIRAITARGKAPATLPPEDTPGILRKDFVLVRDIDGLNRIHSPLLPLMGTVNVTTYRSKFLPGLVFPPETLLFAPKNISRNILIRPSGTFIGKIRLTLAFEFTPLGWNKIVKPKLGKVFREGLPPVEAVVPFPIKFYTSTKFILPDGTTVPKGKEFKPYVPADYSRWLW